MKKIIIVFLSVIVCIPTIVFANSFSDVSKDHSFYVAIESLKNIGIIGGYPDGTFKPANMVNRAEALKMILVSSEIAVPELTTTDAISFSDVAKTTWFAKFVISGIKNTIIKGNPDGTFAPLRGVNKAEFLKMLLVSFKIDLSKHEGKTGVANDVAADAWFVPYMSYAKTVGIITPSLTNNLEPQKQLNRGECADIIYRMLVIQRGGETQKMLSIAESNLVDVLVQLNNNDINKALISVNSAVFYTDQALKKAPKEKIVIGASKVAKAFQALCWAYQAGLNGNKADVLKNITLAKKLADEAVAQESSLNEFKVKIYDICKTLESQLK